ncbi:hypothetical protein [Roseivirga sp. E12]|uniref:hypothetical protein n=1 Tax=Roseivirga sp. E12 TaxID=2819237 RepID=UPI001ABC82A0|nr:hypothetical protein [Roseivirga sp. E12]MBO3698448.1 hypothetical protein [Roseivirga sp. E12]
MSTITRIFILLFLLTNVFVSSALAQKFEFKPGVLFPKEGAPISGLVKYDYKSSTSVRVEFKESESGEVREFAPDDIQGFEFENNSFVSKEAVLNSAIGKGSVFDGLPDSNDEKVWVFLQKLVGGSKTLYVHTDELGITRFFIDREGETELLNYGLYSGLNVKNEIVRSSINDYRDQLESYLTDCPKITSLLQKANYNQKRLVSIFKEYTTCAENTEISFFNAAFRKKPELSFLVGMTLNEISFSDGTNNQSSPDASILALKYDPTPGIAIGIGLNLDLVRSGSLSLESSLLYTTFSSDGESTTTTALATTMLTSSIKYTSIRFNFLPRFNMQLGKVKLFIKGGFSIGSLSVDEDELMIRTITSSRDFERTTRLVDPDQFFSSYAARVMGLGVTIREKLTFETRLELSGSLHGVRDLASDTKRYYFLLGYNL